ncbi:hypothetical protein CTEN210_04066 [Chaetoceros tenuissimus]|uniref:F-box domain-containing protein n=1 Tax=Chaetoceros tenuissimus TaxID=426638 RepID=A0AAD3CKH2_9STRA|nr:hypothetical protein CTEN210_04066 [Chaetoceros tenuissimus]
MSNKRLKVTHGGTEVPAASISNLPNDLLKHCFSFIPGQYVTVAPVCRQFFTSYCTVGLGDNDTVNSAEALLKIGKNKRTTADVVADDVLLFEHYITNNAPKEFIESVCCRAASRGRRDILEYAPIFGVDVRDILGGAEINWEEALAKEGNIDCLKYLHEKFDCFTKELGFDRRLGSMINPAAEKGHVHILQWIYEMTKSNIPSVRIWDIGVIQKIVSFGKIECIKWCHNTFERSLDFSDYVEHVASTGNVDALKWLAQLDGNSISDQSLLADAARSGSIEMLEYCNQMSDSFLSVFVPALAMRNKDKDQSLEVLKWLRQHDCPWDEKTCCSLALRDNLNALKWARNEGCLWDADTFASAAGTGNIEILEYCLANRCPIDERACSVAARITNESKALETLKWLREHSFPWNERTCYAALEEENFSCLMFALQNGCPSTQGVFRRVMESDAIDAFEFYLDKVVEPDSPNDISFKEIFTSSASDSCLIKKLRLLRKYGHEWNESFCAWAAGIGNLNVLRWLRFHGCSWDARTCTEAASRRSLRILEYAHENGCEWDESTFAPCVTHLHSSETMKWSTVPRKKCKEIVEYLLEHNCPRPKDFRLDYVR